MLRRRILIPQTVGNAKCPNIQEYIQNAQYGNAARSMLNMEIPFNQAILFLSNSPEALCEYLQLLIKEKYQEDTQKRKIVSNLYVNFMIPMVLFKSPSEKSSMTQSFLQFVRDNKDFIEKKNLYNSIMDTALRYILMECYLIYGDYKEYLQLYFERSPYDQITKEEWVRLFELMSKLDTKYQANFFKNFPVSFQKFIFKNWRTFIKRPKMEALFPLLCDVIFKDEIDIEEVNLLNPILERMYRGKDGGLTSIAQKNLYYMMLARTNNQVKLDDYYKSSRFLQMPHDFLLRWLRRREYEVIASQLCSRLPDRHKLAITYGVIAVNKQKSFRPLLDLLTSNLGGAEDRRTCWLRALEMTSNLKKKTDSNSEDGWKTLLETATTSNVLKLDDIFPLMPPEMKIDSFQGTILNSIKDYQADNQKSNDKINQFIDRAAQQREIINRGVHLTINLDPLATCFLCKQSIYKDRFMVFPCQHTVHIKCFLSNMNLFYTAPEELNLISLASKAAKSETANKMLSEQISRSCPVCGELAVKVLNKDFILREEREDRDMWSLNPKPKPKEEETDPKKK